MTQIEGRRLHLGGIALSRVTIDFQIPGQLEGPILQIYGRRWAPNTTNTIFQSPLNHPLLAVGDCMTVPVAISVPGVSAYMLAPVGRKFPVIISLQNLLCGY